MLRCRGKRPHCIERTVTHRLSFDVIVIVSFPYHSQDSVEVGMVGKAMASYRNNCIERSDLQGLTTERHFAGERKLLRGDDNA